MPSVLKVSKGQWTKMGMPDAAYDKILSTGHRIIWAEGSNKWAFQNVSTEEVVGSCAYSPKTGLDPDAMFSAKFFELTGQTLTIDASSASAVAAAQPVAPKPKPAKPPKAGHDSLPKMCDVEDVGIYVQGTSTPYMMYMISDTVRLAYHFKAGGGLSIRAEKFTTAEKQALKDWGFSTNTANDGRPYASCHINAGDVSIARKTLGSVMGSILTTPPTKIMSSSAVIPA